jgi:hypothetical protein
MLAPVLTKLRGSVMVLVFPFVLGLVFAATSSLAHRAGETWSPKPSWEIRGGPAQARVIPRCHADPPAR